MKEIEKYINEFDGGHSEFQIENFIIKGQGHLFFQFQQACRELRARHDTIRAKKGKDCIAAKRELALFLKIAQALRQKLRWDDLSPEQKNTMESHAWFEKARHLLAVDLLCSRGQGVSKATMEFVLQLPKEFRKQLIAQFREGGHKLIEWVLEK